MNGLLVEQYFRLACPRCRTLVIPDHRDVGREHWTSCPLCGLILAYDYDERVQYDRRGADREGGDGVKIEVLEQKTIVVCRNPDCRQELTIPDTSKTLRVTCPKCRAWFIYRAGATGREETTEASEQASGGPQCAGQGEDDKAEEGERATTTSGTRGHSPLRWFFTSLPILGFSLLLSWALAAEADLSHKLMAIMVFLFVCGCWILLFSRSLLDTTDARFESV